MRTNEVLSISLTHTLCPYCNSFTDSPPQLSCESCGHILFSFNIWAWDTATVINNTLASHNNSLLPMLWNHSVRSELRFLKTTLLQFVISKLSRHVSVLQWQWFAALLEYCRLVLDRPVLHKMVWNSVKCCHYVGRAYSQSMLCSGRRDWELDGFMWPKMVGWLKRVA